MQLIADTPADRDCFYAAIAWFDNGRTCGAAALRLIEAVTQSTYGDIRPNPAAPFMRSGPGLIAAALTAMQQCSS